MCAETLVLMEISSYFFVLSMNVQRHKVGAFDKKIYMLVYAEALRNMLFCSVSASDACKIHHF